MFSLYVCVYNYFLTIYCADRFVQKSSRGAKQMADTRRKPKCIRRDALPKNLKFSATMKVRSSRRISNAPTKDPQGLKKKIASNKWGKTSQAPPKPIICRLQRSFPSWPGRIVLPLLRGLCVAVRFPRRRPSCDAFSRT